MSNLKLTINKIKCVEHLEMEFPIEKGLFAIAGENGTGKTTILACAARAIYTGMNLKDYFGPCEAGASISYEYEGATRTHSFDGSSWQSTSVNGDLKLKGFYEGSLIFGTRFRDASYSKLKGAQFVDKEKLIVADDFIRTNLGKILQNDENYYEKLWFVANTYEKFDGTVFYYGRKDKFVSQFHMSTGENLLVGILNAIFLQNRIKEREHNKDLSLMFIDEVELALHPASLQRLLNFLADISEKYNYAFYFSTHSIVLLNSIDVSHIFFVQRNAKNVLRIQNPCHPLYATKYLYRSIGFDKIILVEDVLAKEIVWSIIKQQGLLTHEMVHVVPIGGWMAVLEMANEAMASGIFGSAQIISILDQDIEQEAQKYIRSHTYGDLRINYLPIESLEKYLRKYLLEQPDDNLMDYLSAYTFVNTNLPELVNEYARTIAGDDKNGKKLYEKLEKEMEKAHKNKMDIVNDVMRYVYTNQVDKIDRCADFLAKML